MGQINQPQYKNAAAGKNRNIRPLEGSYMIDFNVFLPDLENSDIESDKFEGTKTKQPAIFS